jgi:hypothetical protein
MPNPSRPEMSGRWFDFFGHIGDHGIYANVGKLPPTLVFHNFDDGISSY